MRLRTLRGGFAWVVIATLALGIGATTAIFSVVNGVLLRPLALRDPGQLALLGERVPAFPMPGFAWFVNPDAYFTWRQQATDWSGLAALQSSSLNLTGNGAPSLVHGARVTGDFFNILAVPAALGRTLVPADDNGTGRPMVITDALWRSSFGGSGDVIGRQVGQGDGASTIVGVLPPWFKVAGHEMGPMLTKPPEYFTPLRFPANYPKNAIFTDFNYTVVGRLKPGVTLAQAKAQLDGVQTNLARNAPEKMQLLGDVIGLRDYTVSEAAQELWLLLAGVGAVLLIVCVNLGGLWLTRISDQRRDWAIRAALGATPGRLARQVLWESLGLGLAGGALGLVLAAVGLRTLLATAPAGIPRLGEVHLDARVLAFGLGLSLIAGLAAGLVPAWRLGRTDPQRALKAGGAATTTDASSLRSRQTLIAVEAALCTLLLAAGGLLGLSFYRLATQPTGFDASQALAAEVVLPPGSSTDHDVALRQILASVSNLPGVQSAAVTSALPLTGETWIDSASVPGRVLPDAQKPHVNVRFISPRYFATMGIALLAGRDYSEADRGRTVTVISQAAARTLWPGQSPSRLVGQAVIVNGETLQLVGIADDARAVLSQPAPAIVYEPYWSYPPRQASLVLRTTLPVAAIAAPLRAAIWKVAPDAPIPTLRPLSALAATAVASQRYQLTLILLFALAALALAGMGVYALVAQSVARRAKELGIRMALGASPGELWRIVLGQGLAPVAAGVAAGLVAALAAGQFLASLLFQVQPANPAVLAAVAALVLLSAFLACLLPARRATRVDPLAALRSE